MVRFESGNAVDGVVVARRPIVNRDREILGFELVYHPFASTLGQQPDAEGGVVAVYELLRSHGSVLDDVVGDRLAFCRVDHDLLVGDGPMMLSPRRTVLVVQVPEIDQELLAGCAQRRAEGYTVALDSFAWTEGAERLVAGIDIVTIDVGARSREEVLELVDRCRPFSVRLLAQGCDSEEDLAWAVGQRFDLFQGEAVQSPPLVADVTIAPSALSQVQLGVELLTEDLELERIEAILRGEPGLVVQILNLASVGAGRGLRRQVRSLREALVTLGTVKLRQWAALTILGRHRRVDTDALLTGLVRARMCELLAPRQGIDQAFAFTAGLLSTLDLVLGVELAEIEKRLQFDNVLAAAAFRGEGPIGQMIADISAYQARVGAGHQPTTELDHLIEVGAPAFQWATVYVTAMDTASASPARHRADVVC